MSNFCKRRARQIVAEEVQKLIVKGDLRATQESIKRGVIVDVEERSDV